MTLAAINERIAQIRDDLHDLIVSNDDKHTIDGLKSELKTLREVKQMLLNSQVDSK